MKEGDDTSEKKSKTTIEQRRRWNKAYRERKLLGLVGKPKKKPPARALKQREYNKRYYEKKKAEKRKYTKRAQTNGSGKTDGNGNAWVLADGIPVPDYTFASHEDYPGHLKISITAVVPHPRAMAILHMLEHQAAEAEE